MEFRNAWTATVLVAAMAVSVPAHAADVIGNVETLSVWAYGAPPDEPRRDLRVLSDVHARELVEIVRSADVLVRLSAARRWASPVTARSFSTSSSTTAAQATV